MRNDDPNSLAFLPPPPEAIETISILRQTAKASLAIAELKGVAETIPDQKILINALVLREAKDSSEIENIITSTDELYLALSAKHVQPSRETKEVVSYRRTIMAGFEIIQRQGFLRVNDIIRLQGDLLENNAGLRSTPGTVLKNDQTGEVVYTPPQDLGIIQSLLSDFIKYYNDDRLRGDVSPLIWLAVLHYQFESIHPFYDGNGRIGRILNILFLIMNELLDIPILYLSSYIIQHKADYYRLLNQLNKGSDWEGWILFMLRAVEETSKLTLDQIVKIRSLLETTIIDIRDRLPKIYSKELVELLFEQPYSKVEYLTDRLGVDRRTALKYLSELEKAGLLQRKQIGREYLFINKPLLQLLKN